MKTTFNKETIKALRFPKGATHLELVTDGGGKAVVDKKNINTLDGVEGTVTFGTKVSGKFVALPASEQTAAPEAKAEKPAKASKPAKGGKAAKPAKAAKGGEANGTRLKTLFDCSITSVIRCLASKGWSSADIITALEAKKVGMSNTTVYIQHGLGAKGKGPAPAELTGAQVSELKALVKAAEAKEAKEAKAEKAA